MMKHEFEGITGEQVSDNDYNNIEIVYMHYPGIQEKNDIARIYKIGGMTIIRDLYKRAEKIMNLEKEIGEMNTKLSIAKGCLYV